MIGKHVAHYRIEPELGACGMGEVSRAKDTRLGRSVALKMLPSIFARDPERVARFEREAKVFAALNHANIVFASFSFYLFRTTLELTELKIPYCIAGGMALVAHGYDRTTVDIAIIVTEAGLVAENSLAMASRNPSPSLILQMKELISMEFDMFDFQR